MSINLLAVNIGNTRTQLAVFSDDELVAIDVIDNDESLREVLATMREAFSQISDRVNAAVMVASVNPKMEKRLTDEVWRQLGIRPIRVEDDLPVPIGRQLDPETIVGDDRLLNAAAAYDVLKQACVIVDAGTAITIDFVDGAGTFHGGAIGAGAQLMLDSLHEHTAQLPEVEFDVPEEPIGHNTTEAMRSAAFHGIRGMLRELVEQFAEEFGAYPAVIATGGDAELLFEDYELVERVVPELTLLGMAVTFRVNMARDDR